LRIEESEILTLDKKVALMHLRNKCIFIPFGCENLEELMMIKKSDSGKRKWNNID